MLRHLRAINRGFVIHRLTAWAPDDRESYFDIVMGGIVNAVLALIAVIGIGTVLGSF